MAVFYAANATNAFNTNPPVKGGPEVGGGRVRAMTDTVTYAAQTTSDTIVLFGKKLPVGAVVLGGEVVTSATTGTSTIAIGITGSTTKYLAATAYTTANIPVKFGSAAGVLATTTAEEQLFITIGTGNLPASGTLDVILYYVVD